MWQKKRAIDTKQQFEPQGEAHFLITDRTILTCLRKSLRIRTASGGSCNNLSWALGINIGFVMNIHNNMFLSSENQNKKIIT
jgi:hypothetical protein